MKDQDQAVAERGVLHYDPRLSRDGKKILFETEHGASDYHGSTAI